MRKGILASKMAADAEWGCVLQCPFSKGTVMRKCIAWNRFLAVAVSFLLVTLVHAGEFLSSGVEDALRRAGENRGELQDALEKVPANQREGLEFLIANMPERDLTSLKADFLLENTEYAYRVLKEVPWGGRIPKEIFLNNILPYANVSERRDNWRKDFYTRFLPLVKDCKTPSKAGARLNAGIFPALKVSYSRKRPKADQSPYESIQAGMASCTGLSILLVDACRSVGVPARFAGIPLWPDRRGNHSWVEIWDGHWHFTGAEEPTGDELDRGWFVGRASGAKRDEPLHSIYAASFKRTPLHFPMVWNRRMTYVHAVNVTDRYTQRKKELEPGMTLLAFRVLAEEGGDRVAAAITIRDARTGATLFEGTSKDERFDWNDHLTIELPRKKELHIKIQYKDLVLEKTINPGAGNLFFTFLLTEAESLPSSAEGPQDF